MSAVEIWLIAQVADDGLPAALWPVIITAIVTGLGAWLTFRGKTQDTANWLIAALRTDAEAAREAATLALAKSAECEIHRDADQIIIKKMQQQITELRTEIAELRHDGPPSGHGPVTR